MKQKIHWGKIIANAGVAFFTTLSGTLTVEGITKANVSLEVYFGASLIAAIMSAGLSFMKELAKEEETQETKKSNPGSKLKHPTLNKILDLLVFFE